MKRSLAGLGGVLLLACATAMPAAAQSQPAAAHTQDDELRKEIEALKKGQQEILKQLAAIKQQLGTKPAAPRGPDVAGVVFDLGDNPVEGPPTAKLTLVELTDYQ